MPKFFVLPEKIKDNKILIDTDDVSHIKKVLRLAKHDVIMVCDSMGMDYEAEIDEVNDKSIICDIISSKKADTEPNVFVTLYQGLPKASKMDYIIQKNTELGISRIVPVVMNRCVVKLENKKAEEKKVLRWQKIAEEAAKQSGRGKIPEILMPVTIDEAICEMKKADLAFAPYECEDTNYIKPVLQSVPNAQTVSFLIGPEGGFDKSEIQKLDQDGIKLITLGKRILRTETAGEAVCAMIMYEIGDVNK